MAPPHGYRQPYVSGSIWSSPGAYGRTCFPNMRKLTESNKSGDAEVDVEQQPELRPIWVVAKVYGTNNRVIYSL
jgi:hypothetical protein